MRKDYTVAVRLTQEEATALREQADDDARSVSSLLRWLVRQHLSTARDADEATLLERST